MLQSQCSATCGGGRKHRQAECRDKEGAEDTRCKQADRPGQADRCNLEPCPAWNFGEWGKVISDNIVPVGCFSANSNWHDVASVTDPVMEEYLTAWYGVKTILVKTCLTSSAISTPNQEPLKPATQRPVNC